MFVGKKMSQKSFWIYLTIVFWVVQIVRVSANETESKAEGKPIVFPGVIDICFRLLCPFLPSN